MFSQATVLIDREPDEVYDVLANFKTQISFWDALHIPGLEELNDETLEAHGTMTVGIASHPCLVAIHLTRPKSGLVTRFQSMSGEMAAEFRIMEEGDRTRVEVNIEGYGGGLAGNITVRQLAPRLLSRLKQYFDRA
jgi:carbon monoxide dehydrogenase subunit G